MTSTRRAAVRFAAVVIGLLVPLVVAEVALRFLPFNEGLIVVAVNDQQPLYHFVPNRSFRYSQDWDMKNGRVRTANNVGFLSDVDYLSRSDRSVLAVIGDSFIEAVQVDWDKSVHGRLHAILDNRIDVFAFGAAYASFGQYLAWADYARREFAPDMLVVNVVGNDYDLPRAGSESGFSQGFRGMATFIEDSAGKVALRRTDRPAERLWVRLLRHSALVAYLHRNIQITALPEKIAIFWQGLSGEEIAERFVANTQATAEAQRVARAKRHLDRFLEMLPEKSGLPPQKIIITLDGLRPHLYDDADLAAVQDSFPAVMNRYLSAAGAERGFEVRDLTPLFVQRHKDTGSVFEFPFNGHWNADGHDVMAKAVSTSRTFARTFPDVEP